ncbi:MAG: MotA/TolQ/ExbB proton channel family protein [Granulosicoccus sp.]
MSNSDTGWSGVQAPSISDNFKPASSLPHFYPQVWLLAVTVALFGFYVAWDVKLLQLVFALDRSYMALVVAALIAVATTHAAWHILSCSRLIESANLLLSNGKIPHNGLLPAFLADLEFVRQTGFHSDAPQDDSLVEVHAEKLRGPVDLGWFLVDLAVRLGLLGTIIGFILIFTSLGSVSMDGADGLQELLVSMSGGMGTALLTTLSGLVAATFISLQYLILGREVDHLVGLLVRLRIRHSAGIYSALQTSTKPSPTGNNFRTH